jgi:hypothetical protein
MKNNLSLAARNMIKQEWPTRWKEHLGHPAVTPCQVMLLYVKQLDITVARLDNKIDWGVWDDKPSSTMLWMND